MLATGFVAARAAARRASSSTSKRRAVVGSRAWSSTTCPARVAVVGGGAIGCEFASFLVDVGAEVTILEVLPQILTGVDQQVAQTVVRAFTKRGIKVRGRRRRSIGARPGRCRTDRCGTRTRRATSSSPSTRSS